MKNFTLRIDLVFIVLRPGGPKKNCADKITPFIFLTEKNTAASETPDAAVMYHLWLFRWALQASYCAQLMAPVASIRSDQS